MPRRPTHGPLRGKRVALDFDGVLHSYSRGWTGVEPLDPAVPGAQAFVRDLMSAGAEVVVMTCRADTPEGHAATVAWLDAYGFPLMEVTCQKVQADAYVDDRGVPFETALADWNLTRDRIDRLATRRR